MASKLRVDNILPSVGTGIGIGTANGSVTIAGDLSVDTSKGLTVGTGASIFSPSSNVLTLGTNNAERVRITSSGNIGIGTDNPQKKFVVSGGAQGVEISPAESGISRLLSYNRNTSAYTSLQIEGYDINFIRDGGVNAAKITSGGNVQIANGNLVFSTAGTGIDFSANSNAAGMTSELLDDYEEGTFTPSFTSGTSGSGYTRQIGEYTKIGRLVTFTLTIDGDGGLTGTATAIEIGGLPFTSRNVAEIGGAQVTYPGNFDTTNDRRFWLVAQNNTTLSYRSATAANINGNLVTNVNSQLNLCGYYFTDS